MQSDSMKKKVKPISFGERPGPEPYNASEVVAIADSRFLFCDNNISDALFEFQLEPDGSLSCPLIRRPINGINAGSVDDLEGIEFVETAGSRFILANASLCLKQRKKYHKKKSKRGKEYAARNCILRLTLSGDDQLDAEIIPDFRPWLVENAPQLGKSIRYLPDDGGLNVEAISWDPQTQALLFGIRTPVAAGKPLILRARLKKIDGPWELGNLKMLSPVTLDIDDVGEEQGIRAISYWVERSVFLVVVGNSTSSSEAPFVLYQWDGNVQGKVHHFKEVKFHPSMKVEGVAHGTIGGRGALVFVDDGGGYQVIWDDDSRLALTMQRRGKE
jgi:hypothetical protein